MMPRHDMPHGTYFISHAYRDTNSLQRLLDRLPKGVSPYIFPPIQVSPVEFVSNPLLDALLKCQGVIVLQGGHSDASFWVAFERDYALRAGKPVWRFDASTEKFERVFLEPGTPRVLPIAIHGFTGRKRAQVDEVMDFMARERFFEPDAERISGFTEKWKLVRQVGYVVLFVDRFSLEKHYRGAPLQFGRDRVVLALLDEGPVPDTFDPDLVIRLYDVHRESGIDRNRVDDLIVRLYWMIYRKIHSHE